MEKYLIANRLIESVFEVSNESKNISQFIAVYQSNNSWKVLNQSCVGSQYVLNTAILWE